MRLTFLRHWAQSQRETDNINVGTTGAALWNGNIYLVEPQTRKIGILHHSLRYISTTGLDYYQNILSELDPYLGTKNRSMRWYVFPRNTKTQRANALHCHI